MTTPLVRASSEQDGMTPFPGRNGYSSISDDGNLVVFGHLQDNSGSSHFQIYLKNLTTGDVTQVASSFPSTANVESGRIFGDGSTIVFEASPDDSFFSRSADDQVYSYNVATQTVTLITASAPRAIFPARPATAGRNCFRRSPATAA